MVGGRIGALIGQPAGDGDADKGTGTEKHRNDRGHHLPSPAVSVTTGRER